jgi:hypothetical protein
MDIPKTVTETPSPYKIEETNAGVYTLTGTLVDSNGCETDLSSQTLQDEIEVTVVGDVILQDVSMCTNQATIDLTASGAMVVSNPNAGGGKFSTAAAGVSVTDDGVFCT